MFDVVIIGGGISGLSAAIYTAYGKLSTMILDTDSSQVLKVGSLRNFPGILKTSGRELLDHMKLQAETFGAKFSVDEATKITKAGEHYEIVGESGQTYSAKYVIIATNLKTNLLDDLGLKLVVNEKVPSGKIKRVVDVGFDGVTKHENLYIAGLLAGVSSQSVIAAGQGAQLGTDIVTKETGKTYIWHDV